MVNADHMRLYPPDPYANSWLLWLFVQCAFLMSIIQTSKLKAYFLGAPKPLLYLSGAGGQKLGTRKVQEECLGHFWFIQGGSPRKEQTKTVSALGAHPCHPCSVSFPREVGGKKVNDKTSTEQRIRHKWRDTHRAYQGMLRSSTKGLAKKTQRNVKGHRWLWKTICLYPSHKGRMETRMLRMTIWKMLIRRMSEEREKEKKRQKSWIVTTMRRGTVTTTMTTTGTPSLPQPVQVPANHDIMWCVLTTLVTHAPLHLFKKLQSQWPLRSTQSTDDAVEGNGITPSHTNFAKGPCKVACMVFVNNWFLKEVRTDRMNAFLESKSCKNSICLFVGNSASGHLSPTDMLEICHQVYVKSKNHHDKTVLSISCCTACGKDLLASWTTLPDMTPPKHVGVKYLVPISWIQKGSQNGLQERHSILPALC